MTNTQREQLPVVAQMSNEALVKNLISAHIRYNASHGGKWETERYEILNEEVMRRMGNSAQLKFAAALKHSLLMCLEILGDIEASDFQALDERQQGSLYMALGDSERSLKAFQEAGE